MLAGVAVLEARLDDAAPPRSVTRRPTAVLPPTSPGSTEAPAPLVQDPPDVARDARAAWIARTLAESPPITAPVAARIALLMTPIHQRAAPPADAA
jgi:hypothetical protein